MSAFVDAKQQADAAAVRDCRGFERLERRWL